MTNSVWNANKILLNLLEPLSSCSASHWSIMSCLLFGLILILLTDASLTTSPSPQVDCPSCVLIETNWTHSSLSDQSHLVEIIKQHILNMLHLKARPNLTRPVPRIALLNAVNKLRTGHMAGDDNVEILEQSRVATGSEPAGPQAEIISFAEPGEFGPDVKVVLILLVYKPMTWLIVWPIT